MKEERKTHYYYELMGVVEDIDPAIAAEIVEQIEPPPI